MSKLILYFNSTSPPSRAVYMLLKHLDIDFELKTVDTAKGEQFSPAYLKLNPAHAVPTLVDGDFVLSESRAILAYIINSRKPGSDLYPVDPKARAVVDQRLNYDHSLYNTNGALVLPLIFGATKTPSVQASDNVIGAIKVIESFLEQSKWLAGDNLTIADFSAAATISTTITGCGLDLTAFPNVARWYKQCETLKGFDENIKAAHGLAGFLKTLVHSPIF